jgi:hypothetical protein
VETSPEEVEMAKNEGYRRGVKLNSWRAECRVGLKTYFFYKLVIQVREFLTTQLPLLINKQRSKNPQALGPP